MENLNSIIEKLYQQEPYWNICCPCQCDGYCCIGADVSVNTNEWSKIKKYVQLLSFEEKLILQKNIVNGTQCVFRAANKCLIHEVRPVNCRYTPYQLAVNSNNILEYYMVRINHKTNQCEYKRVRKLISPQKRKMIEQNPFVLLRNFDSYTKYISLNWLAKHCPVITEKTLCVSEWLKVQPLL